MSRVGEDSFEGFNVVESDGSEEGSFGFEDLGEMGEDGFDDFAREVRGGELDEPSNGGGCSGETVDDHGSACGEEGWGRRVRVS